MASLHCLPPVQKSLFINSLPQKLHGRSVCCRAGISFLVRAERARGSSVNGHACSSEGQFTKLRWKIRLGRRQLLAGSAFITWIYLADMNSMSFAAETKKGFLSVSDKKDGYSFVYPFGWQEVVIDGQDKVFKDVIEPLENVSVNMIPTSKEDIRDFGSPQQIAETLIKKVLAPSNQRTKLIEASEHDIDGKAYYTFEFVAQAPNYTRHALSTIAVANGKFYTLTTGANERRWEKMKDKLRTVVDSFTISKV
ncbi:psbP-like protein 1, chloroplastic isoform X1 [Cucurbita pepo subsp. pepo]|uniref:psbP-like protein 1, chloroplastic isoform X1 n=1 Tax=Cucurbita pepo subsp. pepo TaxID=3664 RepID=UPI000C9D9089|nr:psbP-like protein 1, chloroplastic isoform X1 [Cucurbita pepo subsp. pepo]